jgi:phosphoribosyl-ATP pyrophosphohydrolase/phosphoribosyl-AMP cyclohydrolase/histidinol dehydrogenase
MAERFLVSVDLKNLQASANNALDLKTISYLNRVHVSVTPETHQDASAFLRNHFDRFVTYCDCTALENLEDIVALLNCGATKVFVAYWQLKAIVEDHILEGQDLSRLIVSFDHSVCEGDPEARAKNLLSRVKDFVGDIPIGIQVHDVHDWKLLDTMNHMSKSENYPSRYVTLAYNTRDHYVKAVKDGHIAIIPARELTTDPNKYPWLIPAHLLITTGIQSDRSDGLLPTVVTDEHGICLGLVYSSEKSIETALQSGRGVYQSRRHGLWIKGHKSGNTQELLSIALDCDADALQFVVRQKGEGTTMTSTEALFLAYIT